MSPRKKNRTYVNSLLLFLASPRCYSCELGVWKDNCQFWPIYCNTVNSVSSYSSSYFRKKYVKNDDPPWHPQAILMSALLRPSKNLYGKYYGASLLVLISQKSLSHITLPRRSDGNQSIPIIWPKSYLQYNSFYISHFVSSRDNINF
jgi:hypothetical protein